MNILFKVLLYLSEKIEELLSVDKDEYNYKTVTKGYRTRMTR